MEQTGVTPLQSLFIVIAAWVGFPVLQTFVMLILPLGLKLFGRVWVREKINTTVFNIFYLPILTACLYVIVEWAQSWFLSGLTWAKLSLTQYTNLFFIQSLSLFGTYFVSFIIIFINSAIALYILNKLNKSELIIPVSKNNLLILCVILLYFANSYFGYFRIEYYDYIDKPSETQKINAQIVQGNVSSYEKWADDAITVSLNKYKSLSEKYKDENTNITVWPETAIPTNIDYGSSLYSNICEFAEKNNLTVFTGAFYDSGDSEYNAIMAFDKNYDFIQPYCKRHLVPFGEYLPMENVLKSIFPFVANISLFDSLLTPGENSNIMSVNGINYGGLVCFDSIFPELARKSVNDGADILIITTNDSWFRDSPAVYQHNAQAVLRAVENNRYVVRSANTGISSFISPTGDIIKQSDALQTEVLSAEVGVVKDKTVYTVFGDFMLYLAWIFIVICIIWLIRIRINKKI